MSDSPKVEMFYTTETEYIIIYHTRDVKFILNGLTLIPINDNVIDIMRSITWPDRINGPRTIDIS